LEEDTLPNPAAVGEALRREMMMAVEKV